MENKLEVYLTTILCVAAIIFSGCYIAESESENKIDYYAYVDTLDIFEVIDDKDLTIEDLESRNGKLIIERCIGVVENAETGAGRVINADPNYYYISYRDVAGIENGNVICTYFVYNPDNNYCDDIIMRFDYIIERGNKNDI
jgi:hypothetical protein